MRAIEELLNMMTVMTVDMERTEARRHAGMDSEWDAAEKKGDVITVWGVGGTTWKLHWICPHWYWERDRMAAHPVDQELEKIIKGLCKEGLYE